MKDVITQKELAKLAGVSAAYIAKLKKKGAFDDCFIGKKLLKDCALKAVKELRKVEEQKSESIEEIKKDIKNNAPKSLKENLDDVNLDSLAKLLIDVKNPAARVSITKEFWAGKMNEIKFLKEKGKLIDKQEVEKELYEVGLSLREKFLSLPNRLSNVLANIDNKTKIANILEKEIKEVLENLSQELKNG